MNKEANFKVTDNFWWYEFIQSDTANVLNCFNDPVGQARVNLLEKTIPAAQKIRKFINSPMYIKSGYRNVLVNRAIGGAENSDHLHGLAFDFVSFKRPTLLELCHYLVHARARLPNWDQLIFEYNHIHLSFGERMRGQVLTKVHGQRATNGLPDFLS